MSSGVAVDPNCQTTFSKMAEKKEYRYIIYKIDEKQIVVDVAVTPSDLADLPDSHSDNSKAVYEHFISKLREVTDGFKDCRYAVFDFFFDSVRQGAGLSKNEKILFFQICPDSALIKKKMVYASSASAMKQALDAGKLVAMQISDESAMDHTEVLSKMIEKYKS